MKSLLRRGFFCLEKAVKKENGSKSSDSPPFKLTLSRTNVEIILFLENQNLNY